MNMMSLSTNDLNQVGGNSQNGGLTAMPTMQSVGAISTNSGATIGPSNLKGYQPEPQLANQKGQASA